MNKTEEILQRWRNRKAAEAALEQRRLAARAAGLRSGRLLIEAVVLPTLKRRCDELPEEMNAEVIEISDQQSQGVSLRASLSKTSQLQFSLAGGRTFYIAATIHGEKRDCSFNDAVPFETINGAYVDKMFNRFLTLLLENN
ncbi:MAG: hypothetical protein ACF788_10805 [Novipirellula sp. JB048]